MIGLGEDEFNEALDWFALREKTKHLVKNYVREKNKQGIKMIHLPRLKEFLKWTIF